MCLCLRVTFYYYYICDYYPLKHSAQDGVLPMLLEPAGDSAAAAPATPTAHGAAEDVSRPARRLLELTLDMNVPERTEYDYFLEMTLLPMRIGEIICRPVCVCVFVFV